MDAVRIFSLSFVFRKFLKICIGMHLGVGMGLGGSRGVCVYSTEISYSFMNNHLKISH